MALTIADNPEPGSIYQPQSQPTLLALLQIFRRRKAVILLGVVASLVLGTIYFSMAAPVYEAKVQLLVVKKRGTDVVAASERAGNEDYIATQAGIIKSPVVVAQAIQDGNLSSLPLFGNHKNLVDDIILHLKVARDLKSPNNSILELSFRAGSGENAACVLSAIIKSYQKFLKETYQNVNVETVNQVTVLQGKIEKDLKKTEEDFSAFRKEAPVQLLRGKDGASFNHELMLQIHARRQDLLLRRDEIDGRLKKVKQAFAEGRSRDEQIAMLSQITNKSVTSDPSGRMVLTSSLEDRLLPALMEEKMLLEDFGAKHPQVAAARKKIELAQTFVVKTLEQELDDVKKSEELLSKALEDLTKEAQAAVKYEVEDVTKRAAIQRAQQLYEIAIKRLNDADYIKDLGGFDATPLGPPTSLKVSPKGMVIFPLALCLGLLAGIGLGYLAEMSDRTFRSAEEIRQRLGMPIVGHVPSIELKPEALEAVASSGSKLSPMLCAFHRPKLREAEAYRGVRTALYFSARAGLKVIGVTSPMAGDGKSTLTANLALSIALSGKRVIVVDADLRKPNVHKLFGVATRRGLASVLMGEKKLEEVIRESGVPGLSLLVCGNTPQNPAELLLSAQFQEVLDTLREQYDFVLVDTPPVLAVTDPCSVASRVDGMLLTMRITRNGRPDAVRAKEVLATLETNLLGVVVNGVEFKNQSYLGYASYEGYGYYGGYGTRNNSYYNRSGNDGYYQEEATEGLTNPSEKVVGPSANGNGNGDGNAIGGPK